LIKAGTFKRFEPNIDKLLNMIKTSQGAIGKQTELFNLDEKPNEKTTNNPGPHEKVSTEKEAFGFYFSEHPLEQYQEEFLALGLAATGDLDDAKNGGVITIGGIVSAKKIRKDKKGRNYAIVNLEDFEGFIDVFVFSEHFEKHAHLLKKDTPMIIKGRISGDEDRKSLRAEEIVLFKNARDYYKKLFIDCDDNALAEDDLRQLHELIKDNKGQCEIWFKINGTNECRRVRSRTLKVKPTPEVIDKIRDIVGDVGLQIYGRI
jgi:DNA polymerase-3 subunit alpha